MLEALGNLGDFVGGLAVVVTLLYLAAQIRQNTRAVRTASRQEVVAGAREWNRLLLEPVVNDAYEEGLMGYPHLVQASAARFRGVMNDLTLFMQGAFAMWEGGSLENDTYRAYLDFFAANLVTPGGTAWWAEASPMYLDRMVANVEERLSRGGLRDLRATTLARPTTPVE